MFILAWILSLRSLAVENLYTQQHIHKTKGRREALCNEHRDNDINLEWTSQDFKRWQFSYVRASLLIHRRAEEDFDTHGARL